MILVACSRAAYVLRSFFELGWLPRKLAPEPEATKNRLTRRRGRRDFASRSRRGSHYTPLMGFPGKKGSQRRPGQFELLGDRPTDRTKDGFVLKRSLDLLRRDAEGPSQPRPAYCLRAIVKHKPMDHIWSQRYL